MPEPVASPGPDESRPRPRVLLADDHPEILRHVVRLLTPACTIVGAVGDGREAIAAVASLAPDVLLLDITMPGMSGFDVARRIHGEYPSVAVVFLSMHQDEDLIRVAYSLGAADYVTKSRLATDLLPAVLAAHQSPERQPPELKRRAG